MSIQTILNDFKTDIENQILNAAAQRNGIDFRLILNYILVRLGLGEIGGGSTGPGGTELADLLALQQKQQCIKSEKSSSGLTVGQSVITQASNPVSDISFFATVRAIGGAGNTATVVFEGTSDPTQANEWGPLEPPSELSDGGVAVFQYSSAATSYRIRYVSENGGTGPTLNIFCSQTYKGEVVSEGEAN